MPARAGMMERTGPTADPARNAFRPKTNADILSRLLGGTPTSLGRYFGAEFVVVHSHPEAQGSALGVTLPLWRHPSPGGVLGAVSLCALRAGLLKENRKRPATCRPSPGERLRMERAALALQFVGQAYMDLLDATPDNLVKTELKQRVVPGIEALRRELHQSSVITREVRLAHELLWNIKPAKDADRRPLGRPPTTQRFIDACTRAGLIHAEQMAQVYSLESGPLHCVRIGKRPRPEDHAWKKVELAQDAIETALQARRTKAKKISYESFMHGDAEPD